VEGEISEAKTLPGNGVGGLYRKESRKPRRERLQVTNSRTRRGGITTTGELSRVRYHSERIESNGLLKQPEFGKNSEHLREEGDQSHNPKKEEGKKSRSAGTVFSGFGFVGVGVGLTLMFLLGGLLKICGRFGLSALRSALDLKRSGMGEGSR